MRVDLDAKVVARDGEELGSVDRAIFDPRANEVTHFAIGTGGLFGFDVLVPVSAIEAARRDGDAIRLDLTKDEVERLPPYVPVNYSTPPPGWTYTGAYGFGAYGGYVWPMAGFPVTGHIPPESYPPERRERQEAAAREPVEPSIGKGAIVYDRDGEDVGVVDDVRIDATSGELLGVVVRVGGFIRTLIGGGDSVSIGGAAIGSVGHGAVYLRVSKEEIEPVVE